MFSSVRVQVRNATIRVKLTFDQARCDQASGRIQFCQSSSRKCHAPQSLAGFVAQSLWPEKNKSCVVDGFEINVAFDEMVSTMFKYSSRAARTSRS